jgi:transposase InsO family protein
MQLELATIKILEGLADDLSTAKRGEKGMLVKQACEQIGRSKQWIYDRLKELGLAEGRKRRSDRGQSKISRQECIYVSNMMVQTNRDNGKQLMSLKLVVELAVKNGVIDSDVSIHTVSREMKRHKVHPDQVKQGTPHRQVRSLYPNHVWQFDVSLCVLYYLPKSEGLQVMLHEEFYKNKLENVYRVKNDRVLRYLVTDHYTGSFYVEYFNVPGENSTTLVEFLLNSFEKRDGDPFHGVPSMLVWDAGTANQSHLVKGMLERLDVKHHTHEVGSPRAKGQVERTHNLVECEFESRLSMCLVESIEQLNAEAWSWAQMYNATKQHRRHGHTRYGLWQTIKAHQLRLCPERELCMSLLQKIQPATRKVKGDLTIDFAIKGIGTNNYSVECIPDVCIGDTVQVTYNPYKVPVVTAIHENLDGEAIHYELQPIVKDAAGFNIDAPVYGESYKSTRDTPVDSVRKDMNRDAFGVETDREAKLARKARKPAFDGRIDPFADVKSATVPDFMQRRGQGLRIAAPKRVSDLRQSYAKAVPIVRDSIGIEVGSEDAKRLTRIFKQRYPDGIPEEELHGFTAEMLALFSSKDELKRVENGE